MSPAVCARPICIRSIRRLPEIDGHATTEGLRRPGKPRNAFVSLEQAGEATEFAIPVFLASFDDHGAGCIRHDDLFCIEGAGTQHAYSVVMRQDNMRNGLVGNLADFFDDLAGKSGRGLCLDDHDAVIADDDAGIGISLSGKRPEALADFGKTDGLFGQVAL